ncbi:MAG: sulfatase [Candidatus Promineifilaceae bacterium]|nr:sulfatase [Candidatus Promineifilaceae bacterium]
MLPDIFFIVLDTQRVDRLGCYGYQRNISPNLDNFASKGIVFEQAISPAQWTVPSHASMFTGLYPTAHQLTQSSQCLDSTRPHLAELLEASGYETVGFCNNPLVGVLNNGFKRGFQQFYNYGGAIPSLPHSSSRFPWPLNRAEEAYTQFLRRISYPIQNFFGRSDLAFRISLQNWATPLWSKMANFKGQNERSVKDVSEYLLRREKQNANRPLFLFLNLMETHLPFWPPGHVVDQVAPYFRQSKEARDTMRTWNREAYRWAAPLEKPLSDLESQVLNDMYDAEVAFQDGYLNGLFGAIEKRANSSNTLTIIVADHGDGLGEHGYMGHAFVAYQELVHVPLILSWPAHLPKETRVKTPVSTRRVFHTMLNASGSRLTEEGSELVLNAERLSLENSVAGADPEQGVVISEIYPPLNFVKAIKQRQPHLIEQFGCLLERRAIVQRHHEVTHKLIQLDGYPDQLFNLESDRWELEDLRNNREDLVISLDKQLTEIVNKLFNERAEQTADADAIGTSDGLLMQRLRGLGYVD